MIIINKLNFLVNILSNGMNAGIGNLIAEGNNQNTMKIFWELSAIRFLIAGIVIFSLLLFLQPFIACWLGPEYRLSNLIVYLLIFNIFIYLSRGVVEMYISACGLFSDIWAAWAELILNLSITLYLAPQYGIVGILTGKIISVFFIAIFWKPYFLFTKGLNHKVSLYWKGMAPYYIIFVLYSIIVIILKNTFIDTNGDSPLKIIEIGILVYLPILISYFLTMFLLTSGTKYFVARKPKIYKYLQYKKSNKLYEDNL